MSGLQELHSRWNRRVTGLAVRILGDHDEAQEAAQEVFIEVWRRLPEYDAARGSEWSWLRMMTQSRCFDRLRSARRRARLAEQVGAEPQHEELSADDPCDLTALLGRLPPHQRDLMELAFVEGCTHREIALRTGQPLGTVKTRLRLGLQRLAASFKILQEPAPFSEGARRPG